MDALDVLRQCHLVELTDEFGSIGSLYALTVSGEDFVGQLISVGARPILDDLDLTEEDSRFLQAAVKLSEENEGAQAKRKALTTRDVFEQLGWLGTGNVPVRTRRLMDRLRTMQLVETTGPGTPLDKDIGPVYDFTPSYKAYLWYAQRSER